MFDTEAIYLTRLEYLEHDDDECGHPAKERWPFRHDWEICGICGAIVRPADFIPVWKTDFMNYMEQDKENGYPSISDRVNCL